MFISIIIGFAIFALISAAVTGWALSHAPVGYEDESGFQPGVPTPAVKAAAPHTETVAVRSKAVALVLPENDELLQVTISANRLAPATQGRGRVSVR